MQKRKIAIIGVGPRGGYALERLIIALANENLLSRIHISLFEQTGDFGNGQVYGLHQNPSNWINITERVLDLKERELIETGEVRIVPFPSYKKWASRDFSSISKETPDTYPPRSQIGAFLSERFQSLIKPLIQEGMVSLYSEHVKEINWLDNNKLEVKTDQNFHREFDEILLTIGHQPTALSEQITAWEKLASDEHNLRLFKSPYPISNILSDQTLKESSKIGIRGFGLSMIDVSRAIAERFGEFLPLDETTKLCEYKTNLRIKNLLIPFSLDGLPPVPKPLNAKIDSWFQPSEKQLTTFEEQIGDRQIQKSAQNPQFLIEAFIPIASVIFMELPFTTRTNTINRGEVENTIERWLSDQNYEHPLILSHKLSAEKSMQRFVGMAVGEQPISLDFCIGQVWRHCQPSIYKALSFNACPNKVFAAIIELDESTKRYSYGPPVESIQQLLALSKLGILNLDFVNNPDTNPSHKGWHFTRGVKSISVNWMIDSVLDPPEIKRVQSSLVKQLLSNDLMQAIHDDLGIATDEKGYLVSGDIDRKIPIALLGRLAKGTIIGVDAILECFGARPQAWARQAAKNHKDWFDQKMNL